MRNPITPDIKMGRVEPLGKFLRSAKPPEELPGCTIITVESVPVQEADPEVSRPPDTIAEATVNTLIETAMTVLFSRGATQIDSRDRLVYEDNRIFIQADCSTRSLFISVYSPSIANTLNLTGDWVTVVNVDNRGAFSTLKAWVTIDQDDRAWTYYLTELADCPIAQEYLADEAEIVAPVVQKTLPRLVLLSTWTNFIGYFLGDFTALLNAMTDFEEAINVLRSLVGLTSQLPHPQGDEACTSTSPSQPTRGLGFPVTQ